MLSLSRVRVICVVSVTRHHHGGMAGIVCRTCDIMRQDMKECVQLFGAWIQIRSATLKLEGDELI